MDKLYPPKRWRKLDFERTNHSTKDIRTETLWMNYDPSDVKANRELRLGL